MKKIANILLLLIFFFLTNVSAKSDVVVKNISKIEESERAEEISEPTHNDLNLAFNVRLHKVDDFIKYKVELENTSNTEYEMDLNIESLDNNYIKYDISYEDNLHKIAANSLITFYVTISYQKEIPNEEFTESLYKINYPVKISLASTNKSTSSNTATNQKTILFIILIIVVTVLIVLTRYNKKIIMIFIIGITLIVTVYAADKLMIVITANIEIPKEYSVYYIVYGYINENDIANYKLINDSDLSSNANIDACKESFSIYYNNDKYLYCKIAVEADTAPTECSYSSGTYMCDDTSLVENPYIGYVTESPCEYWLVYKKIYNSNFDDDQNVMNFSGDWGWSSEYGRGTPINRFIMPNHDIYFTQSDYSRCI